LQEYIPLGQRVKSFSVDVWDGQQYQQVAQQTTIGYKRILTFPTRTTTQVRVNILDAKASPVLSELQVYKAPEMLAAPEITRDKNGLVQISSESIDPVITFTTDGQQPTMASPRYTKAFALTGAGTIKARAFIGNGKQASETITAAFDVSPVKWQVASVSHEAKGFEASKAIDANPRTYWLASPAASPASPPELAINLGEPLKLSGFTYTPRQDNKNNGILYQYNFYVSADGKNWQKVIDQGTFANIKNNPVRQEVKFEKPYLAQYIRLQGLSSVNEKEHLVSAGEIGILTK
jgi:alpha-L-fucosidase